MAINDILAQANTAYIRGDYGTSLELYSQLVRSNQADPTALSAVSAGAAAEAKLIYDLISFMMKHEIDGDVVGMYSRALDLNTISRTAETAAKFSSVYNRG